jgi:hypothetical protein
MVNENRFQFDRKASLIFGKRFTIFKTVNRFPKLNSSFLHARLISDCQNLAIVNRRNPTGTGVRQHPVAGIRPPALDARHQIPAGILPDSGQAGRILPLIGADSEDSSRIWQKQSGSGRI